MIERLIAQAKVVDSWLDPTVAVTVTEYVPAVVGVPVISPEDEAMPRPGGSPLSV
jgi:hypothetical protein